jgi:hypothetical protein
MRFQAVPDDQQRLLQMHTQRLEEFDDLLFLDAAFVKTKQAVGSAQPRNRRNVRPPE